MVTSKFEYRVYDFSLAGLPDGVSEGKKVEAVLNECGTTGWQLDRFWDSDGGNIRHVLLRREIKTDWKTHFELTSFS